MEQRGDAIGRRSRSNGQDRLPGVKRQTVANPGLSNRDPWHELAQASGSPWHPGRREKPLARRFCCPYRIPTLVGRGTSPQVDERTSVKELGKLTPYLRKKGYPGSFVGLQDPAG